MKGRMLSWLSYVCIGIILQCFVIVQMCDVRGSAEVGGEYLILPAMILIRAMLEDVFREER